MCCDSPSPPAPDPNIGLAAQQNAEVAKELLAFNKQVYEGNKPRQAALDELAKKVVNQQLGQSEQNAALAQDYADYMKGTFRPIEKSLAAVAETAGGAADQERLAAEAGADVSQAFEAGRGAQTRDLARMGLNPNSGAFVGADTVSRMGEAATRAKAMNDARTNAKNIGWAKKMDVASVGRNLPSSQATSSSLATSGGSAAMGSAAAPMTTTNQNAAQMNAGYAGTVNANNAAGNLYLGQYNAQMTSYNAQQQADAAKWAGIGSLAGTGIGSYAALSSKKAKHKKRPADENVALKGLKRLPVEKWNYKKGMGDDGATRHMGPYAEDFKKEFGVGDGKTINVVDAMGVTMAAIQGLSKKVDKLEQRVMKRG